MRNWFIVTLFFFCSIHYVSGQASIKKDSMTIVILSELNEPIEGALIAITNQETKQAVQSGTTSNKGDVVFYLSLVSNQVITTFHVGYEKKTRALSKTDLSNKKITITLTPTDKELQAVSVKTQKKFIEQSQGKVIINPDASVTNVGTTILEVLEKSPGVMVDKNGGISLQGKNGVLILIDDKQTYLSGADLNNLLNSMSSSMVEQIELITNPSAKYDAAGNAGIINIKTKKNKQIGFNGVITLGYGQGKYPKTNDNFLFNYRNAKLNAFLNYSLNYNKGYTDLYALRHYYAPNGTLLLTLDQPTYLTNQGLSNTIKSGIDFFVSSKTTLGFTVTGVTVSRNGTGDALASWINAAGKRDSSIRTLSESHSKLVNGAFNLNGKHNINKEQEISFDIDMLKYNFTNEQRFSNTLQAPGGYTEGSLGSLPATIDIMSAKVDYRLQIGKNAKLESGYKISAIKTDNNAEYQYYDGTKWVDDYRKSNHFLYKENINALYTSFEQKLSNITFQSGLRYEHTFYDAHQLGNPVQKDSAFSKKYSGFFPSGYISYQLDSANRFTLTASRRIDRPPFQKLNPYVIILNKYTLERGNPYLLPQFSWNFELSHQFKDLLTTTFSYQFIKDYFSQIFLSEGNDILVYTNGNVGKMTNIGFSMAVQKDINKWWSIFAQGLYNYKEFIGYQNINYQSSTSQFNININNQFRLGKSYAAELSGFYTSQSRNDLQELLSPSGQVSAGISKPILKKKGTLKLSLRDIFYTQVMEGYTDFPGANEYFILRRDSRVIGIAFTYRFGKVQKNIRRNSGSAGEEIERVGSGG